MLLQEKVSFITGGSKGIGESIVLRYLEEGAHVYYFSRSKCKNHDEMERIAQSRNVRVVYIQGRVSNEDEIQSAIKQVNSNEGRLDILVNNAGITRDKLFIGMQKEDWEQVLDVNLTSIYYSSKIVVPIMLKQRSGSIINMSSIVAITGNPGQVNYCTSKAGMIGFTKSLALEIAKKQIRVNAIAPGFISTDMTNAISEDYKQKIIEQIPMKQIGMPLDIANACVFFGSDLSQYITGQVLTVSGGL